MWTCPQCHRSFSKKHQSHSCVSISEVDFLQHVQPQVKILYEHLKKTLHKANINFLIEPVKNAIYFIRVDRFLAVKFYKESLEIDFKSDHQIEDFPIVKSIRYSKTSYWNMARVSEKKEITSTLVQWIKDANGPD